MSAKPPIRLTTTEALRAWRDGLAPGTRVGVVPTMGGLHEGHAALVRQCARECEQVVVTVFVNPIQFDEASDFEAYPREHEADAQLIAAAGGTAIYLPTQADMYPEGCDTRVHPGPGGEAFEGEFRQGHFDGVLTVVLKLFQRVRPTHAYFGEKDAQQLFLVRRMVADLDLTLEVRPCPTVREADGLALSSRNRRLDPRARSKAATLYRALTAAREAFEAGERSVAALENRMRTIYLEAAIEPEYAAVVDEARFLAADEHRPGHWRAVTAARLGSTRLIDNLQLGDARHD